MTQYIDSSKLADSVFKKADHANIARELQVSYDDLELGSVVISGLQIKTKIEWVHAFSKCCPITSANNVYSLRPNTSSRIH